MDKTLKYEFMRCDVEAIDETAENLEDTVRRHNRKILYCYVKKLRENSQYGHVPIKDRNGTTISDK